MWVSAGLASELLLGRYNMPPPLDPKCALALHEAGVFAEARQLMASMTAHRTEDFNRLILPLCQPLVESIGHRMAYEAALAAAVDDDVVRLYEMEAMKKDLSWYVENMGLSRKTAVETEAEIFVAILERFPVLLAELEEEIGPFCTAPILSEKNWHDFVEKLPKFVSSAKSDSVPFGSPRSML